MRRCNDCTRVLCGTLIGCLRFTLTIPALLLVVTHVLFPPIGSPLDDQVSQGRGFITEAPPTGESIPISIWGFIRMILELGCCLVVIGDAVVTTLYPSGRPAARYSFLSLLGVPRWMARGTLTLIVAASFSCMTYSQIEKKWSLAVAQVYGTMPGLALGTGLLASLLGVMPVSGYHPWLSDPGKAPLYIRRRAADDEDEFTWKPRTDTELVSLAYSRQPVFARIKQSIEALCALLVPACVLVVSGISVYQLLTLSTKCPAWQSVLSAGLIAILAFSSSVVLIYQVKTSARLLLPAVLRVLLVYLLAATLGGSHWAKPGTVEYYVIHTFGLVVILVFIVTYIIARGWNLCRRKAKSMLGSIKSLLGNFRYSDKRMRTLQTFGYISALLGLTLVIVALPLPWYQVNFRPEKIFEDFLKLRNFLSDQYRLIGDGFLRLAEEVGRYVSELVPETCAEYSTGLAATTLLSLLPGVGLLTGVYQKGQVLLRQSKLLGQKATSARREVTGCKDLLDTVQEAIVELKKPLLVGLTTANFGLVVFVIPILLTGLLSVWVAFWPRMFVPALRADPQHQYRVVKGSAILLLVLNLLGLILFETWAPQFSAIAGAIPLVEAELQREPAVGLVEAGFCLAILASLTFLVHAVISQRSVARQAAEEEEDIELEDVPKLNFDRRNTYTSFRGLSNPSLEDVDSMDAIQGSRDSLDRIKKSRSKKSHRSSVSGRVHRKMSAPLVDYPLDGSYRKVGTPPEEVMSRSPKVALVRPSPPPSPARSAPASPRPPPQRPEPPQISPTTRQGHTRSASQGSTVSLTLSPTWTNTTSGPRSPGHGKVKPPISPKPAQYRRPFQRVPSPLVTGTGSRESLDEEVTKPPTPVQVTRPLHTSRSQETLERVLFDRKKETTNNRISQTSVLPVGRSSPKRKSRTVSTSSAQPDVNTPPATRRRHKSDEPQKKPFKVASSPVVFRFDRPPLISTLSGSPKRGRFTKAALSPKMMELRTLHKQASRQSTRESGKDSIRVTGSRKSSLSVGVFGRVTAVNEYLDRIPPRGWCLSLLMTSLAVMFAVYSCMLDWVSFSPVLKPKWNRRFAQLQEKLQTVDSVVLTDFSIDGDPCGILAQIINLTAYIPNIHVISNVTSATRDLISLLQTPGFSVEDHGSDLHYVLEKHVQLAFLTPTFLSFVLVFIGFCLSFSSKASSYFPAIELMSWLKRLSLFVILHSCNTIFIMFRQLQGANIPLYNLHLEVHSGFAFGIASQFFILLVVLLLHVEVIFPPEYEESRDSGESHSILDLDQIQTPTFVGPGLMTR